MIIVQFVACIRYLAENRKSADIAADRYDFLLDCIPENANVAASPQLWLAFERRHRDFALLYRDFDGLGNWEKQSRDPLGRFDVILLTDYVKDDFDRYAALSVRGRTDRTVRIGARVLHVYSKPGVMAGCADDRLR